MGKLQGISIWLFMVFSLVYFFIPIEYDCVLPTAVILWGSVFYIFIYGLIVTLLVYFVREYYGTRRLYYIFSVIYFSVLILINAICLVKPELYGPLISKTGPVTIPFIIILSVTGILNIYLLIKRSQKP